MNEMNQNIADLLSIVEQYANRFERIDDTEFSAKPSSDKWSKKEVLGHLIDSAQNNLRRFIVAQYESTPPKITYEQDFWVTANGYQHMDKQDVIQLWKLINQRIAAIWKHMDPKNYNRQADTGKADTEFHTLAWLAADYNKHMKHHINQIIPASFDVIYK
jgi:hypothetical protein